MGMNFYYRIKDKKANYSEVIAFVHDLQIVARPQIAYR
jgi:hypothetical protein